MVDATTRFFEDLGRRGYEPLLAKFAGTLRFDLHDGAQSTHWLVRINHGRVEVSQQNQEADTVVNTSPALLEEMTAGREHGLAAVLRGDMTVSGDARLIVQLERLFPGDPKAVGPRRKFPKEVC